ncbi:glycosyltransferase family 2 protein [Winogradskyella undariae]|uniref:glycosyltransferase family 2 protein n=1 Tax=Winogradskyella undariae TaxID=1285465 RepID=UPI00156A91E6|nr:glycosyltransferase family 2 protein [Winogradskyella undariae]NRR91471.1 glycosyltransferase family 2 protein [Winogradskyella undariae]
MNKQKKVYIILVNYNNETDTIECLESLLKQSYSNYQVLVVDNSETEDSFNVLKDWSKGKYQDEIITKFPNLVFPLITKPVSNISLSEKEFSHKIEDIHDKVIFIKSEKNEGFAAANNIVLNALKTVKQDFICWLLNNDTVVKSSALDAIVTHSLSQNNHGVLGTSLMEYSCGEEIQSIGGLYNPKISKLNISKNEDEFRKSEAIKYPNGASMVVTKDYLDIVGPLSEDYFLYFEELDWVLKGAKKAFEPSFLVEELVYHKGGSSTGKNSTLADYYYTRGRLILTLKFFKKFAPLVFLLTFVMFPLNRIIRGQFKRVFIIFKAFKSVYKWSLNRKNV